jgi:hypothetical protein
MSGRLTAAGYRHLPSGRDIEALFPVSSRNQTWGFMKPVMRVTDGKIFESATVASLSMGLGSRAVSVAICAGHRSGGHYWKLAP